MRNKEEEEEEGSSGRHVLEGHGESEKQKGMEEEDEDNEAVCGRQLDMGGVKGEEGTF